MKLPHHATGFWVIPNQRFSLMFRQRSPAKQVSRRQELQALEDMPTCPGMPGVAQLYNTPIQWVTSKILMQSAIKPSWEYTSLPTRIKFKNCCSSIHYVVSKVFETQDIGHALKTKDMVFRNISVFLKILLMAMTSS